MPQQDLFIRKIRIVALIFAIVYLISGMLFFLAPTELPECLSDIISIKHSGDTAISFWHPLSVSMMSMLVVCCFLVYLDPVKNLILLVPVIISKLTSSTVAICMLLYGASRLLFIIPSVDFPLFIITLYIYLIARKRFTS